MVAVVMVPAAPPCISSMGDLARPDLRDLRSAVCGNENSLGGVISSDEK